MKMLKFLILIVVVVFVSEFSVAIGQTRPPQPLRQPPLYDGGSYVPQVPDHVDGTVFVNKQIPVDRYNGRVDIRHDEVKWGHLGPLAGAMGLNIRYRGHAGGPSVRVRTNRTRVALIRNTRVNKNFWRDVKRQNRRR
ncbi:MAG: hypothetical protein L6Q29_01570 [Candidatus Pacebacteria bacterium]|nr:hypothetical protein [Candidatus Paceibacterota bacterium]NUQ57555.1 hypothetical protein [Candidatus Paceibacter sp.]